MARPRFTTDASSDLEAIIRYLDAHNPDAAIRMVDHLESVCWQLARDPGIGQPRPDLATNLRFFPVSNYLIFYRESSEGIDVIRVIHGARDYRPTDF